ncbi:redoxin domain-containing protein [Talaromyces proteolyticus]|uniref:thioredoxin-dependent peroxiredoxin n=1 Tax=Talaromyces proteolyticus TaxID=1131652 RepID=A0AAD4L260_9EURO|nr:redoxin domain-containing protein [Talaromyces proteolyticus]KAH8705246.1 redoxin domain-containing protein [Talaromyces proteolyticus]
MTQQAQLSAILDKFHQTTPKPVQSVINKTRNDFIASFDPKKAIHVGDHLPEFRLTDAVGTQRESGELLTHGPLLITFYRGEWCPFCNIALVGFQKIMDDIKANGVTFVAISPQLPNESLSTAEKHDLQFPVLSDVGNEYARQLGILFHQPDSLRPIFEKFGHSLPERNGDDSMIVPVPATILVDKDGIVKNLFLDPDYTKRVEPATVLEWISALKH